MSKLFSAAQLAQHVSVYKPDPAHDRRVAVLYLHGGGLMFGKRDDLPAVYREEFLAAGYTIFALDYPLAPEAALEDIHQFVYDAWQELIVKPQLAGKFYKHVLFGRSAGAYLSLQLAARIQQEVAAKPCPHLPEPAALLSFYGFYDLADPAFVHISERHQAFAPVTRAELEAELARVQDSPLFSAWTESRYHVYVYARQNEGAWLSLMGLTTAHGKPDHTRIAANSLSEAQVAALPPAFLAASQLDGDIPYRMSCDLKRLIPGSELFSCRVAAHDFDRDTSRPEGAHAYACALRFLQHQL